MGIRLPGDPTKRLDREGHGSLRQVAHELHQHVGHGPALVDVIPGSPGLALFRLEMLVGQGRILLRAYKVDQVG